MKKMSHRGVVYLFLNLLLVLGAGAQPGATAPTLLWKISGKGAQESYFVITTSLTCESKVVIPEKVRAALGKVKQVMIETGATDKANGEKIQKLFQLKNDDQSAKHMLSPPVYGLLKQKAEEMGVDELYLNQYTMFYIYTRLLGMCVECTLPGVDRMEDELRDYCKKSNMPVGELLSIEEVFGMYDNYPKPYWEKSIGFLLNAPDKVKALLNVKTNFYKQENYPGLKQVCIKPEFSGIRYGFTGNETTRMLLLYSRIEKAIKEQPSLMTMDASEVANDTTSIFTLLANAGYTISPVVN